MPYIGNGFTREEKIAAVVYIKGDKNNIFLNINDLSARAKTKCLK